MTAAGATTTTTNTFDAADELTQSVPSSGSPTGYTYDANGNQLTAGGRTNTFNLPGLLTGTTTSSGHVDYSYDPAGSRLTATTSTGTTRYAWDPNSGDANLPDLVDETLPDGTIRATDWLTPTLPTAITLTGSGSSTVRDYLLTDPQHSVDAMLSPTGTITGGYSYDPFGNSSGSSGSDAGLNQLRYTAAYLDPVTGVYDNRARSYDPVQGRFTSTDPLLPDVSSPYSASYGYADSNPLTQWDPTGLRCGLSWSAVWDCPKAAAKHTGQFVRGAGEEMYSILDTPRTLLMHPMRTVQGLINSCTDGYHQSGGGLYGVAHCLYDLTRMHRTEWCVSPVDLVFG